MTLPNLTVLRTIAAIRSLGLTCSRTPFGEYHINIPNGTADTAYFTEDARDVLGTARKMRCWLESVKTRNLLAGRRLR